MGKRLSLPSFFYQPTHECNACKFQVKVMMKYVPSLTRVFSMTIKSTHLHCTGEGKKFQSDLD